MNFIKLVSENEEWYIRPENIQGIDVRKDKMGQIDRLEIYQNVLDDNSSDMVFEDDDAKTTYSTLLRVGLLEQ